MIVINFKLFESHRWVSRVAWKHLAYFKNNIGQLKFNSLYKLNDCIY